MSISEKRKREIEVLAKTYDPHAFAAHWFRATGVNHAYQTAWERYRGMIQFLLDQMESRLPEDWETAFGEAEAELVKGLQALGVLDAIRRPCPRHECGTVAAQIEPPQEPCQCCGRYLVWCPDCGIHSSGDTPEEAVSRWNAGSFDGWDDSHDEPVWSAHDWPTAAEAAGIGPEGP